MLDLDDALEPGRSNDPPSEPPARIRWSDALMPLVVLALLVLYLPDLMFPSWTPRFVVLLAVGPLGLVLVAKNVVRREPAAILLALALSWTLVVGALGEAPRSALLGVVGRDLSGLTVALSAGLWAIGRHGTARSHALLALVLVWGASVNAVVALMQVVLDVDSGPLALAFGRPTGLVTNPVYLGAICASAVAAGVALAGARPILYWAPPTVLCSVAVALSGSRVALLAAVLSIGALVVVRRSRVTAIGAGIGVAGLAAGVLIDRALGAGRNAADRLASGGGGGRTQVWRYGLEAWAGRPLDGYGFGRFRPAVQSRFDVAFVRDAARDEVTQAWFDPHNAAIAVLVAVGLVGFLLYLGWVVCSLRGARGPNAWALLPLALHWMLQPMSLYTVPLAAVLLGGAVVRAVPDGSVAPRPGRGWRVLSCGAAVLGIAAAIYVATADVSLRRAADRADGDAAASAAEMFLRDAVADDVVSQVYDLADDTDASLVWRRHAAAAEPDRPFWWSSLARRLTAAGQYDEAEDALARAYRLQPNNVRTLYAEMQLAVALRDEQRLAGLLERACDFGLPECELDAVDVIAEASAPPDTSGGP